MGGGGAGAEPFGPGKSFLKFTNKIKWINMESSGPSCDGATYKKELKILK